VSDLAWPLPMDTLSPSALSKFQRCAEQFRRQYIHGEWDRASVSAIVGNAVHESAERNFRQKTTSWVDLSESDTLEAYAEAFDNEVEEKGGESEIDWSMKVGQSKRVIRPGEAKDRGVPLATKFRNDVGRKVQPYGAEEWFRIRVEGVPVPIRGKIDLITQSAKRDMKFGAYAKQKPDSSWMLQAYIYSLVEETTNYDGSPRITGLGEHRFEWYTGSWGGVRSEPTINTPTSHPELGIAHSADLVRVAKANLVGTVDHLLMMYRQYGPDEPWPTTALQHGWACSYCPLHPTKGGDCFWWTGNPVVTL
jgi:hypothetical protein